MSGSTIGSTISIGVTLGVGGYGSPLVVTQSGEINATAATSTSGGAMGADAIYAPDSVKSAVVTNGGTLIAGTGYIVGGVGVDLYHQDLLTNAGFITGGYSTGQSGGTGVYLAADAGSSLMNSGVITGGDGSFSGGTGLELGDPGNFIFYPGQFTVGSSIAGNIFNSGLIRGGTGEHLAAGQTGGPGSFGDGGVGVFLGAGTLLNAGTIAGGGGPGIGGEGVEVYGSLGATLINAGTIAGGVGAGGTLGDAFVVGGRSQVANTLVVDPGAVFIGNVVGTAAVASVLVLGGEAAGTLDGVGGQISGFGVVDFAAGAHWNLSGTSSGLADGEAINGFAAGDTISLQGFSGSVQSYVAGTGLEVANGTVVETLGITGSFDTGSFLVTALPDATAITLLCYLRGTRIATPAGEVAVEALGIGDAVITRFGGYRKIKWIGRQSYAARFIRGNRAQIPVCIRAGALGNSLPKRDLFVSPGHSMLIGNALVLARDLVNGITITQDELPDEVHYYQLEFDTHDCVLAEGAWSESFCDYASLRNQFHNAAEFWSLYPEHMTPAAHAMCAPRPAGGPALDLLLRPVVARAASAVLPGPLQGCIDEVTAGGLVRGWAQDLAHPALPVLLELTAAGRLIGRVLACDHRADLAAAGIGTGRAAFTFQGPELGANMPAAVGVRRARDGATLGGLQRRTGAAA